jgi:predicted DNA binding CopG/RHH family protein
MNKERIARIQLARTNKALDQATEGYREQVLTAHPALRIYRGFAEDLHDRQYSRALRAVRRAASGRGDRYQDVIHVLESVVARQLALITA